MLKMKKILFLVVMVGQVTQALLFPHGAEWQYKSKDVEHWDLSSVPAPNTEKRKPSSPRIWLGLLISFWGYTCKYQISS